jgi:hypothetical protein
VLSPLDFIVFPFQVTSILLEISGYAAPKSKFKGPNTYLNSRIVKCRRVRWAGLISEMGKSLGKDHIQDLEAYERMTLR